MGQFEKLSVLVVVLVGCLVYFQFRMMFGFVKRVDEEPPPLVTIPAPAPKPPDLRPGRVVGRVADAAGSPVGRFSVQALLARPTDEDAVGLPARESDRSPWAAVVSSVGEFTIGLLAPGRYRVRIASQGFAPATSETVVVCPGAASPPLVLRLHRARGGSR